MKNLQTFSSLGYQWRWELSLEVPHRCNIMLSWRCFCNEGQLRLMPFTPSDMLLHMWDLVNRVPYRCQFCIMSSVVSTVNVDRHMFVAYFTTSHVFGLDTQTAVCMTTVSTVILHGFTNFNRTTACIPDNFVQTFVD